MPLTVLPTAQALQDALRCDLNTLAPFRAFIFGSQAALHRYGQSAEKTGISLGAYNPQTDQSYLWPGRQANSLIDLSYTKLWLENAYLNYFNDYIGSGNTIAPAVGYTNRIIANTLRFKTSGTFARDASLLDRDVQVGDIAYVRGTVAGTTYELWTTVKDFVNDVVASAVTALVAGDTGNKITQVASSSGSLVAGSPANDVDITVNGTAYESSADGYLTRTYTIAVTQSSTGGNATTARLSVTSADGGDNQASVTPAVFGSATPIGTKGLTVTFNKALDASRQAAATAAGIAPDDLVVGQRWTVTVGQLWTAPVGTASGTYTGPSNTRYIVKVTNGGLVPTLDPPASAPTATAATAGGALAAGTYFAKWTLVTANGETTASPSSASFTTSAGNLTIPLTLPGLTTALASGATSANIYLTAPGGAAGTETRYMTGVTTGTVNLTTAYTAGAAQPTSNTAVVPARVGKEPQVSVSTTTGIDTAAPVIVNATNIPVNVGNFGVRIAFNQNKLAKGDTYYVDVTSTSNGAIRTLVLANDLPLNLQAATDLDLRLFINKSVVQISALNFANNAVNWTSDQTYFTAKKNIQIYDPSWTSNGVQQLLPVYKATVYAEYREWLTGLAGQVIEFTDVSQVQPVLGTVDPDNPIAFGVMKALQNTPGALFIGGYQNSTTLNKVRCAILGGDPTDPTYKPWNDVLTTVTGMDGVYNFVALTSDPNVHNLVINHVKAQSDPVVGLRRACLVPVQAPSTVVVVDMTKTADLNPALATLTQDPGTVTTSYTYLRVPAGNAKFVTNSVQPGDTVRYLFGTNSQGNPTWTEYSVAAVISEDALRLTSGPSAPVTVAQKVQVWRNLSKDQLVNNIINIATGYASDRVELVWPDTVQVAGVDVAGYYGCAALAGLYGSVPSHQSLSNVEVQGIDAVPRSTSFLTVGHISKLVAGGVKVLSQAPDGTIYVRRDVTTDISTLQRYESMVRRNTDMVAFAMLNGWSMYFGYCNNTTQTMAAISNSFFTQVSALKALNNIDRLGPPVYSITMTALNKHPTLADRIQAKMVLDGPFPLNGIELTITV